ncbi:MAG: hypothetical protein M3P83_12240 [Actinomycetota bacterium]|nr:hypothetical protein [Actinomycetota bacterium]
MTTANAHRTADIASSHRLAYGIAGGLAGGLVFGVLMQMMGMISMIGQLVGTPSTAVGWVVHLAISAFLGALFALLFGNRATTFGIAAIAGMAYGVVWWVLGALLAMPARLGMEVFTLNAMAWQSLMGHVLYGLVLGLVYAALVRREQH